MSRNDELREAHEWLLQNASKSKGFHEYQRIEAVRETFTIYSRNFEEFNRFLERISLPEIGLDIVQQGHETNREVVFLEIERLLFNYLAASNALIGQYQKYIKHCDNEDFVNEYEKRKELIAKDGLCCFFKEYRNYVEHNSMPHLSSQYTFHHKDGDRFVWYISKDELLNKGEWKSIAREWLSTQPSFISILEIVNGHFTVFCSFFEWFYEAVYGIYKIDIEETRRLIKKANYFLTKDKIWKE